MVKRKRTMLAVEATRRNAEQVVRVGQAVRSARLRRRLTQLQVSGRAGIARSTQSAIERGLGAGLTLDTWQRVAVALDVPLRIELGRDPLELTADAGHLALQELVLRLGRAIGYGRRFELPTRPAEPWRSTDVGLRNDRVRRLILVECWNTIGDIGAAARSSSRKAAEMEALAIAAGGNRPHEVHSVWVVRATARNRALVGRYPEVFAARFPGSSAGWARALVDGAAPPAEPGLVWSDVQATRLFAWRRR